MTRLNKLPVAEGHFVLFGAFWGAILFLTNCGGEHSPPAEGSAPPAQQQSSTAPVTVSAVASLEPSGDTALALYITNSSPDEIQFDTVITTFYGEGNPGQWFATVHQIDNPGTVSVSYIFKGVSPPTAPPQFKWRLPSGLTEFVSATLRNKDYASSAQRYVEVSLGYGGRTTPYRRLRAQLLDRLPNPAGPANPPTNQVRVSSQ